MTRSRALTLFPGMALGAGLLGGMLGIGGGMIMNPLLIEIGMHPQVLLLTHILTLCSLSLESDEKFPLANELPVQAFFLPFLSIEAFLASIRIRAVRLWCR